MARIYKESRYVLQLLIGKSYVAQYDDVKISFYTKNPNNQVMVDNGITIKRNIAEVKIESTLFDNLEEGLISYIVYGTKDGIPFIEERQSNYFLKTPLDFKPTTCNLEDKSVTPSMGDRNDDGYIIVEEDEVYDGLSRVVIDPQTLYNEGVNEQKSKLESISITENGVYSKEDGYNHIEVNVIPKINVKDTGLNFAYSTFTEVPEWVDFEGITDMSYMFSNCYKLQTIPPLNTSNVTNMENMFDSCYELTSLPALNAQSLNMSPYNGVFGYNELPNLVNFGGFLNLKCSLITNKNLRRLPNLTYESCINILNGLYDFRGNGDNNTTSTLNVHQNFLDAVGEEISIGTNKGWTITV